MTEKDLEATVNADLADLGMFNGLKADSMKKARKDFKGSYNEFLEYVGLGCIGIRAGTHKLVMKDFAATFEPIRKG